MNIKILKIVNDKNKTKESDGRLRKIKKHFIRISQNQCK